MTNHTVLPRSLFLRWSRRNSNLHVPGYRNLRTTWSLIPLDCVLCLISPSRSPKKVHPTFTASSVGKKYNQGWYPPPYTRSDGLQFPNSKLELWLIPRAEGRDNLTRPDVQVTDHLPKQGLIFLSWFSIKISNKMQNKFTASSAGKKCNQDWYPAPSTTQKVHVNRAGPRFHNLIQSGAQTFFRVDSNCTKDRKLLCTALYCSPWSLGEPLLTVECGGQGHPLLSGHCTNQAARWPLTVLLPYRWGEDHS